MEVALIKNITSSVIFKLTLKVQVPFRISMLLQVMTVSSFFKREKEKCWKLMRKSRKFEVTFGKLGKEWELTDELFSHLEELICVHLMVTKKKM